MVLLACLGAAALAALAGPAAYLVAARPAAAPGIVGFAPGPARLRPVRPAVPGPVRPRRHRAAAACHRGRAGVVAAVAVLVLSAAARAAGRGCSGSAPANAIGMSVIGLLLVLAVRRHAGPAALAGLRRASRGGIVAAAAAGAAGWGVVAGLRTLFGGTPGVRGEPSAGHAGRGRGRGRVRRGGLPARPPRPPTAGREVGQRLAADELTAGGIAAGDGQRRERSES